MPRKVAVLGLDCADPLLVFEMFRPQLPVLNGLLSSGLWGRLRSCDPPITCPAWMVMLTGASPGELGVYGFRNRTDYSYTGLGFATSTWIKHEKVWDVLSRHERHCITLGVPMTFPPQALRGCQVSCFLTPGPESNFTYPPELKAELAAACGQYIPDVQGFRTDDKVGLLQRVIAMTDNHTAYAKWLLRNKPWDFFMLVEMGVDRIHHGFWKYFDKQHPRYEFHPQLQSCLPDYYRHVDASLGRILEDIPDDAWVVVVSDHGIKRMAGGIVSPARPIETPRGVLGEDSGAAARDSCAVWRGRFRGRLARADDVRHRAGRGARARAPWLGRCRRAR
ncbi:MAG: alkaline phosphatase family protein, partial [Planctomycetota bacterium]